MHIATQRCKMKHDGVDGRPCYHRMGNKSHVCIYTGGNHELLKEKESLTFCCRGYSLPDGSTHR